MMIYIICMFMYKLMVACSCTSWWLHVHVQVGGHSWNATACSYSTYIGVVAITHSTHVRNVKMYTLKGDDQGWRYCFHCLFV